MSKQKYQAVIFDLYTALLNSWSLWSKVARSDEAGLKWRNTYLKLTYQASAYRPYEIIIKEAAKKVGIPHERENELIQRWGEVEPWPETERVLRELTGKVPVAVATNSSIALAEVAVSCIGITIPIVITAEAAGYYKPNPHPYRMALERLRCKPEHVIFVAGSAADVPGASGVGMPVFWHNRMNMSLLDSSAKPRYVSDTLLPLLNIVEKTWRGTGKEEAEYS